MLSHMATKFVPVDICIIAGVSKRLGLLSRIRPYLTFKAAKFVYNCLVQPMFNYTNTVWGGLSVGCSKNLQRLQKKAVHTTEETFQMLG